MRQLSLSFYDRFISVLTPSFNPLSPDSDENEISCSNIQVMRIKEMITKDEMSCCLDKFS